MLGLVLGMAGIPTLAAEPDTPVLQICTADPPFQPFTRADGHGLLQLQLAQAARQLHLQVKEAMAPRKRCLDDARNGSIDALFAAYAPERQSFLAFPMNGQAPDPSMAMAEARYVVYRRKGTTTGWDGHQFTGLQGQTVGVQRGFLLSPKFTTLDVKVDDGALTATQLVDKLALGRNAAIVVQLQGTDPELLTRYRDRIEALPEPFDAYPIYLAVTPRFLNAHPEWVAKLWSELAAQKRKDR